MCQYIGHAWAKGKKFQSLDLIVEVVLSDLVGLDEFTAETILTSMLRAAIVPTPEISRLCKVCKNSVDL